jgi:CheY-like chemotaxis protein
MMPDLSGFEVLDRLKADDRTAGIPVIIRTSKVLDPRDRDLLTTATAIVSKESKSQEASHANLAEAFRTAGFPLTMKPGKEVHHV